MVGNAGITYLDPDVNGFRVIGFKILKGVYPTDHTDRDGNFLWVAPPSFADPVTSKLTNMFFAAKSLWKEVENKIIESYLALS